MWSQHFNPKGFLPWLLLVIVAIILWYPFRDINGDGTTIVVDCTRDSLADALRKAKPGAMIKVSGTCKADEKIPLVVKIAKIVIDGLGTAILDGNGLSVPVITFDGAQDVVFRGFTVRNGQDGIVITNAAQVAMEDITTTENKGDGLLVTEKGFAYIGNTEELPPKGLQQLLIEALEGKVGRIIDELGCAGTSCQGAAMSRVNRHPGWLSAIKAYWAGLSVARIAGFDAYAANCVFKAVKNGGYGARDKNGQIYSKNCTKNLNKNGRGGMALFDNASALIEASTVNLNDNKNNNGNVSDENRRGAGLLLDKSSTLRVLRGSRLQAMDTTTNANQRDQLKGISVHNNSKIIVKGTNTIDTRNNKDWGIEVGLPHGDTSKIILCQPAQVTISTGGNGRGAKNIGQDACFDSGQVCHDTDTC